MKTEEELTQDFKDWLGWNDQDPPDQDDPDYYTYSWGLNVWINSHRAYQSKLSELPTEDGFTHNICPHCTNRLKNWDELPTEEEIGDKAVRIFTCKKCGFQQGDLPINPPIPGHKAGHNVLTEPYELPTVDAIMVCEWVSDWIDRREKLGEEIFGFEYEMKRRADNFLTITNTLKGER